MRCRVWLPALCLVLLAFAARPSEAACPREEPFCDSTRCAIVCTDLSTMCADDCTAGGITTTCGEWDGNPANDLDGDFVANGSDNCVCVPNSNQTDCDTDGIGDACDYQNEKWVLQSNVGQCDWDGDNHFGYIEVEIVGVRRYVNACDGSLCNDKYNIDSGTCSWGSSCGWSDAACCTCHWGSYGWCANDNNCGNYPDCPF